MDSTTQKAQKWIDNGKDPRSAHWQAGLEAMFDLFSPYLSHGKLMPVQSLENDDVAVYNAALEKADLSPDIKAAFLPPPIAGKMIPPDSAGELLRIDKDKPSYKMLILRPGKEDRILCAEISPHAKKPGADIFQEGALLGSYDYDTHEDCLSAITQTIRVHMWPKDKWGIDQHRRYTVNWFEKVMDLQSKNVSVEPNFSFLHSPTLIKGNKIDGIFMLISEILDNRFSDPNSGLQDTLSAINKIEDQKLRDMQLSEIAQRTILDCLNLMRDFNIIDFAGFSKRENEQFKDEFSRTLERVVGKFHSLPH